jgi:hypothetical protein
MRFCAYAQCTYYISYVFQFITRLVVKADGKMMLLFLEPYAKIVNGDVKTPSMDFHGCISATPFKGIDLCDKVCEIHCHGSF